MEFPDRETLLAQLDRGRAGSRARQARGTTRTSATRSWARSIERVVGACPRRSSSTSAICVRSASNGRRGDQARTPRTGYFVERFADVAVPEPVAGQEGDCARGRALQHRRRPRQLGRVPDGAGRDACRPGDGRRRALAGGVGARARARAAAESGSSPATQAAQSAIPRSSSTPGGRRSERCSSPTPRTRR